MLSTAGTTLFIQEKASSSVQLGRCSATTNTLSSLRTLMENTAILEVEEKGEEERERGREELMANFMACIPNILWCTYIHTQKQLKIYEFLSKPYRLNCVPRVVRLLVSMTTKTPYLPPEDEGVRFHGHHCGYDVLRVVSAPGHLDQSVQSPTDEHQSSLWSSVPAITHSLSQSVSQQHTYRH